MRLTKAVKKSASGLIFAVFSGILCVILGIAIQPALTHIISSNLASLDKIIAILIVVSGLFLYAAMNLIYHLWAKARIERKYYNELREFKAFTDNLLQSSSEIEAYQALCNQLEKIPEIDKAIVMHHDDTADAPWTIMPEGEESICILTPSTCPVFLRNQKNFISESSGMERCCPYRKVSYSGGSSMCRALDDGNVLHDVIEIYSNKPGTFKPSLVFRIDSLLKVAVPIISNKRALGLLNIKATTDKLTKVYNRNFLEPYLENQIEAANLSKQQISLIMVDMDHFKSINDIYGHLAGDHILAIFAQQVLKCIRKTDLVARYGGDEFIVVLPSTDTKTAQLIAERIRETVSGTVIPPIEDVEIPNISCSVGVSTYPVHCTSKDELIRTSDIALYKAKQSGRNRTIVYYNELVS